jgi:hypothetical protein
MNNKIEWEKLLPSSTTNYCGRSQSPRTGRLKRLSYVRYTLPLQGTENVVAFPSRKVRVTMTLGVAGRQSEVTAVLNSNLPAPVVTIVRAGDSSIEFLDVIPLRRFGWGANI